MVFQKLANYGRSYSLKEARVGMRKNPGWPYEADEEVFDNYKYIKTSKDKFSRYFLRGLDHHVNKKLVGDKCHSKLMIIGGLYYLTVPDEPVPAIGDPSPDSCDCLTATCMLEDGAPRFERRGIS